VGATAAENGRIALTCKAFPKRIPQEILDGKNLHLKPVEGDHGIQFEVR